MTLLTRDYAVRLYGTPATKGSMKCIGARGNIKHQLVEQLEKMLKPWRALIVKAGLALPVTDLVGPIGIEMTVTIRRPPSHYRTGRNAHLLRADAPVWPSQEGTGDVDKYGRAVLDSLQKGKPSAPGAGVMKTDAQVVELIARKCYPDTPGAQDRLDRPGAVIRIFPIGG
jgi:crossover junction endodeoxyribonuclease RusA